MKTKHIVIQMIKIEMEEVDPEEEIYLSDLEDDLEWSFIIRLDKYVTKDIVVTKGSFRDTRKNQDYQPGGEYRGEEQFQMLVNFFKKEGYEVI